MILIPLRLGVLVSMACLGLGLYFLHQVFVDSGKDLVVVVFVAPVFCSVGLLLSWATLSHYKSFRAWEHYRRKQANESSPQR